MSTLRPFACGLICLAAFAAPSRAAEPEPLMRGELDKRLKDSARETIELGRSLYNAGNHEGCYRLYEGSLWTMKAVLDHRPAAKMIGEKMAKANGMSGVAEKAFALREALDAVMMLGEVKKPLWDRLGGEKAVKAVVHDFVVLAAGDEKVNFFRDGKFKLDSKGVEHLEALLVELISATTGGPLKYTGRDLKKSHAGMKITDAEFDALAGDLIAVLKKYKVPQTEMDELVGIIAGTRKDIVEVKK